MSVANNVIRRGATYHVRAFVPADLQAVLGKKEVHRSLRTKDAAEAKRRARTVLEELDAQWQAIRKRRLIEPDDIEDIVWQRYKSLVAADDQFRLSLATDDELDEIWRHLVKEEGEESIHAYRIFEMIRDRKDEDAATRAKRLELLKQHAARGEVKAVAPTVLAETEKRQLLADPTTVDYKRLAQGVARAEIEALSLARDRDIGDWSDQIKDRLVKPPTRINAAPGETIAELFETYATENPEAVKPDTLAQSRMAVLHFADFIGPRLPVASIDKKAVRAWKALLLKYPVKAAESKIFKGLSLAEIVAKNDRLPDDQRKPRINPKTVNRYLAGLGAFCTWLEENEYISGDPLSDMFLKVDKKKITTIPFSTDQLSVLFSSPLFTGCASYEEMNEPGNFQIRDHRYWLPLVMLYSGARPAELGQLLVKDVREHHGVWIIHITEEGDETKSTKTKGSMRVVPIHPELIRLGFVEFCKAQAANGEWRVFPEAQRNSREQMGAKFSRDFGRMLIRLGIKEGRGLTLYSFRHGFIDGLRRGGYLDEQFPMLVGHSKHSMTGQYGQIPQGMLELRVQMVNSVNFPGLDLTHLYPEDSNRPVSSPHGNCM